MAAIAAILIYRNIEYFVCDFYPMPRDPLQLIMLLLLLVVFVISLVYREKLSLLWRIVQIQLGFGFLAERIGRFLVTTKAGPTSPVFNSYILVEQLLLLSAGFICLKLNRFVWIGCLLFLVSIWVIEDRSQGREFFNNYSFLTGCIVQVVTYTMCIIKLVNSNDADVSAQLWLFASLILYFACSIPIFSAYDYLTQIAHKRFSFELYTVVEVLGIIRYVMTFIAILFATNIIRTKTARSI